jgi:hypothetical protein
MSQWLHLNLYFKDCQKTMLKMARGTQPHTRPQGTYKELINYLNTVVNSLGPRLIHRYFYFFEPQPHLFLALEVKNKSKIGPIKDTIGQIRRPDFIRSATVELSDDRGNGEVALDFFHAATKFSFFRISDKYKPVYTNNNETKLIHCFCNQLFITPENEIKFYSHGIKIWEKYLTNLT